MFECAPHLVTQCHVQFKNTNDYIHDCICYLTNTGSADSLLNGVTDVVYDYK